MGFMEELGRSNALGSVNNLMGKAIEMRQNEDRSAERAYTLGLQTEELGIHKAAAEREATKFQWQADEHAKKQKFLKSVVPVDTILQNTRPGTREALLKLGKDNGWIKDVGGNLVISNEDLANAKTYLNNNLDITSQLALTDVADINKEMVPLKQQLSELKSTKPDDKNIPVLQQRIAELDKQKIAHLNNAMELDKAFQEKKVLAEIEHSNKGLNVEKVIGPDGKPVFVPRSTAVGMEPYVNDSKSAMEDAARVIVELGKKPNLTSGEKTRLESARLFVSLSQQTGMSQPVPIYDDKGKFTGLAGIVNKGGQMTTTYMPVAVPSGSTAGPKPSSPSDAFTTTVNQLSQITSDIKRANETYKPGYVGFVSGPAGQAMDKTGIGADEQRQVFNSSLKGMKSIMVYLRTGKQINETEIKNLEKELPTGGESEAAFRGKMKRAVSQLGVIMDKYYDQQKGAGHTNFEDLGRVKEEVNQLVKQYGLKGSGTPTLPKGIPVGSKLYGKSKGGKDVYQTPAGKFFEVD